MQVDESTALCIVRTQTHQLNQSYRPFDFCFQVPREGLEVPELDRAAGEPARRAPHPDPQPQLQHQVRVPGHRHQRVRRRHVQRDHRGADQR